MGLEWVENGRIGKSTLGYLAALEFIAGVAFLGHNISYFLGHNSNDLPTNRIGA
jgi:hypothetical protein